ncbi:hypothetical protein [Vibrio gazogenes]|uniref:Uncharacterized protein n=1 Tax=Vibrio gazogenes DSM 21264 = NBRC 103151 TaxID=1123492 RepID=A0A1M5G0T2_VIBGA|nr:hypothetical protein [Vibrio gazogenes]USP14717.1 hypothetical protein MKS89_05230 [Vibrio gazogenes]SHF97042.1 hypothetical protein SAMN02745781_03644 [Vibrio gazogenes DSM 21264] [Vibrio gazogenes DSM 21264 = NBRC 103151]SJN52890.1 hypothetical protein BQ6471_00135 [Vibrio gazogenes]
MTNLDALNVEGLSDIRLREERNLSDVLRGLDLAEIQHKKILASRATRPIDTNLRDDKLENITNQIIGAAAHYKTIQKTRSQNPMVIQNDSGMTFSTDSYNANNVVMLLSSAEGKFLQGSYPTGFLSLGTIDARLTGGVTEITFGVSEAWELQTLLKRYMNEVEKICWDDENRDIYDLVIKIEEQEKIIKEEIEDFKYKRNSRYDNFYGTIDEALAGMNMLLQEYIGQSGDKSPEVFRAIKNYRICQRVLDSLIKKESVITIPEIKQRVERLTRETVENEDGEIRGLFDLAERIEQSKENNESIALDVVGPQGTCCKCYKQLLGLKKQYDNKDRSITITVRYSLEEGKTFTSKDKRTYGRNESIKITPRDPHLSPYYEYCIQCIG